MEIRIVDKRGCHKQITVKGEEHIEFDLRNEKGDVVTCRAYFGTNQIWLGVDGYGSSTESDEDSVQIAIDVYHHNMDNYGPNYRPPEAGHVALRTWLDINRDESESYSFGGTRLDKRDEE